MRRRVHHGVFLGEDVATEGDVSSSWRRRSPTPGTTRSAATRTRTRPCARIRPRARPSSPPHAGALSAGSRSPKSASALGVVPCYVNAGTTIRRRSTKCSRRATGCSSSRGTSSGYPTGRRWRAAATRTGRPGTARATSRRTSSPGGWRRRSRPRRPSARSSTSTAPVRQRIDSGPKLDENLGSTSGAGGADARPDRSTTCRAAIERYSRSSGCTATCTSPRRARAGPDLPATREANNEGILRGALIELRDGSSAAAQFTAASARRTSSGVSSQRFRSPIRAPPAATRGTSAPTRLER